MGWLDQKSSSYWKKGYLTIILLFIIEVFRIKKPGVEPKN